MNIGLALLRLFPNADPLSDYLVQDDGDGAYIARWNLPNPLPTEAELLIAWQQWVVDNDAEQQAVEAEKADLSGLGQQIAGEIDYLQTDIALLQSLIPTIGGMTATQIRTVVEGLAQRVVRLEQENAQILKALRYVVRRLI